MTLTSMRGMHPEVVREYMKFDVVVSWRDILGANTRYVNEYHGDMLDALHAIFPYDDDFPVLGGVAAIDYRNNQQHLAGFIDWLFEAADLGLINHYELLTLVKELRSAFA